MSQSHRCSLTSRPAQAVTFVARWTRWIRATEACAHPAPLRGTRLAIAPSWGELRLPAYVDYDRRAFDFRALVLKILAPAMPAQIGGGDGACTGDDALAMLHATPIGARELGYATPEGTLDWRSSMLRHVHDPHARHRRHA